MPVYTASDVAAVQNYMSYKDTFIGNIRDPELVATIMRGREVISEAVLRYSTNYKEAQAAPKDSPVIARMYKGRRSYYWLLNRSTFQQIKNRDKANRDKARK